ncbi:sigma-70 family RNA polymerase sigma factor [Parabacteroides sp. BX2]|jgi:RNA polymerase sigma-70 factor (family 1)|uniref:RNA polymerase sigma factor n=1 Tax=Parabacteroides segnis TaxID=2763058 RepID=A0ABR7EB24_9BACT|nr:MULTISPECIES: sigma-70 family RNA polymerase sigma factor [Parabacteroides]MBC5646309.1 sigma-70 family RNA polymerase sigma factor [Parabacteroides segnis]MCM0716266.1 sigma-70 family RNA polymerase sigma factor [Parabacteroides sp. TA-V-105]
MDNSYQNRKIVKSLAEGSYSAFEELYFLYNEKLYHFIMRLSSGNTYMAEEVVQLTFIRVWEIHEKIDPNESFISFICTVGKNILMNMYQRQTLEYIYNEYIVKQSMNSVNQTEESSDVSFLNDFIESLIEELPKDRKIIFVLSKKKNYSNKEISDLLGISESTIRSQLSLATNFMRKMLMKYYYLFILMMCL